MKKLTLISAFITIALTACGAPTMTAPANNVQQTTDHQAICSAAGTTRILFDAYGLPKPGVQQDVNAYFIGGRTVGEGKEVKFSNKTTLAIQVADGSIYNLGSAKDIADQGGALPRSIFNKYNGNSSVRVYFKPDIEQLIVVSGPPNLETSIGTFPIANYYCS